MAQRSEGAVKRILTIVIGFVHDFAAGCWAATVLAIYWLSQQTFPAEMLGVVFQMKKQFFYLGLVCVVLVFATGAGRTFTYVTDVYGPEAERIRRRLLIIKHIVLFLVFGGGTYWQYAMTFN